ncbi:hypothetical protein LCGC14_1002590 [marine sediment metagenome]|uniref:Uncharacterized protein n=1 Tax=marine sediment metagenome TaxID=412755 RepID=A0A0F9QL41_9ZZZZ
MESSEEIVQKFMDWSSALDKLTKEEAEEEAEGWVKAVVAILDELFDEYDKTKNLRR